MCKILSFMLLVSVLSWQTSFAEVLIFTNTPGKKTETKSESKDTSTQDKATATSNSDLQKLGNGKMSPEQEAKVNELKKQLEEQDKAINELDEE